MFSVHAADICSIAVTYIISSVLAAAAVLSGYVMFTGASTMPARLMS
jgi:hypothetical protein